MIRYRDLERLKKTELEVIKQKLAELGHKYDGRKKYKIIKNQVCEICKFTTSCSGCFEGGEYMGLAHNYSYDSKAHCHVGMGCDECGYTGKRVVESWVPMVHKDWED